MLQLSGYSHPVGRIIPPRTMARFIKEYEPDMKTALVTGAAGVLGRATVRMLLEDGFRVRLAYILSLANRKDAHLSHVQGQEASCNLPRLKH
jgi:hypothetical protein